VIVPLTALQVIDSLGSVPTAEKACVPLKATVAELGLIDAEGPPIAPAQRVVTCTGVLVLSLWLGTNPAEPEAVISPLLSLHVACNVPLIISSMRTGAEPDT
jgi:hypothetical protein